LSKVSSLIICKNEEKNIEECIKSVLWCDEIILIDSFSQDNTITIANKYSVTIFQNEWRGFADQRKFALSKINTEWIFSLDADERCTIELQNEIRIHLSGKDIAENGFEIPRKSFFLKKWIRHGGWYPNYQLRLFRKESAGVSDRLVHESYTVEGKTGKLQNDILHYTVTSVKDYMRKINSYSDLSALEKVNRKKIGYLDILVFSSIFLREIFLTVLKD
jgi:glycosyltransferase involved in cell wall biosynthesis